MSPRTSASTKRRGWAFRFGSQVLVNPKGGERSGLAGGKRKTQAKGRGGGARGRAVAESRRRWRRVVARVIVLSAFALGFATSSWILKLDRVVVERFEGKRFRVPSKVLSAPAILYPGLDWKRIDLEGILDRLGYRAQTSRQPLEVGRYRWGPSRLHVHLRSFDHPSRPEPARDIGIVFSGSIIERILELPSQREVGAVLLEPELVGAYYGLDHEQRELVRLSELPSHLSDAVLAVEDQRFASHHGVDIRRILGALVANLRAGGIRQGASTLTQQLVKNFFLTPAQTLSRKAQEAVMALLVEARYDKEAILETYLNEIYLGQRGRTAIHGVGEGARFFFGKQAVDLSAAESALLAAILQSPNRISPHQHPERALRRRNLVLTLMREQGRLDEAEYQRALVEPLQVASVNPEEGQTRYFLDALQRQLPEVYDREVLEAEGVRIYSTLDTRLQRCAARALVRGLERIEQIHPELRSEDPDKRLQGCLVALRPQTGEVLALVGGRDYGRSQFDRCTQARRAVGSAFKPFVYIAALEPGAGGQPVITLADRLEDTPLQVQTNEGVWEPQNYDHEFRGLVSVREALERSLNVPAARLGLQVGIDRVAAVARRLGITSKLPEVPSLALGTAELAPIELARAYATVANGGIRPYPHTFEDVVVAGETHERRHLRFERVLEPEVAFLAVSLLRGVVDRGTAVRVRWMGLEGAIAGKTGTSDDERDLWFVGFTPELVAVVWVGYDEPRPIGLQSSQVALPIWVDFVKEAVGERVRGAFPRPPGVRRIEIHPETGARALPSCPEHRTEYFLPDTEPTELCVAASGVSPPEEEVRRPDPSRPQKRRGLWDWLRGRRRL
jgi:penicillin-binding protein 1B